MSPARKKLEAALNAWPSQSSTRSPYALDDISSSSSTTNTNTSTSTHTPASNGRSGPVTGSSRTVDNPDLPLAVSTSTPIPDRGHGITTSRQGADRQIMDPFEVRIRFTQHLQHLNASVTSANKAAQYALKYRDMDEDLHSCILEQLERNSMNNRANIMYFIEHLCDMAAREGHQDYVRMMQRDILRVVDAVAPEDGSGAANVKVVRKVLQGLQIKSFLLAETVAEIEECLRERDTLPDAIGLSSPLQQDVEMAGTREQTPKAKTNGFQRLDKKQIEQRIEEDRERHKRLREHIWAVPAGGEDVEYEKVWEETSDLGEDDEILFKEENLEAKASTKEFLEEYGAKTGGSGD